MELDYHENLWNQVLLTESFATAVIDYAQRILCCNKGFLRLFSLLPEESYNKNLCDLIDSTELKNLLELIRRKGERTEFTFFYSVPLISICWVRVEATKLQDDTGYLLIFYDLTEAYQAQMIMEAHSMVSDDIFLFFDNNDYVLHCSEKAAKLFGFSSGREAMGLHYTTLMQGKANLNELEELLLKLHQQEGLLGYLTLKNQKSNSFYEFSGFHVNLRTVSMGFVLLFKVLENNPIHHDQRLEEVVLREESLSYCSNDDKDLHYEDTISLFWNSKECKEGLIELQRALEHYEYIEINKWLERMIVLAPKGPYTVLQSIQNAIIKFEYEKALTLFYESRVVLEI